MELAENCVQLRTLFGVNGVEITDYDIGQLTRKVVAGSDLT
jgi:hypothetical protein